jgi:hypothetical protein
MESRKTKLQFVLLVIFAWLLAIALAYLVIEKCRIAIR